MLLKFKLTDYNTNDIIRIIREWTDLDRSTLGKNINKSEHTIKNYEIGKSNYTVLFFNYINRKLWSYFICGLQWLFSSATGNVLM